jgi:hypothetical protein
MGAMAIQISGYPAHFGKEAAMPPTYIVTNFVVVVLTSVPSWSGNSLMVSESMLH